MKYSNICRNFEKNHYQFKYYCKILSNEQIEIFPELIKIHKY